MVVLPGTTAPQAGEIADKVRKHTTDHPFQNPDGMALPLPLCFGIADVASAGRSAASFVAPAMMSYSPKTA